jgi:molybdate transport system ATP-binding protein
MMISVDVSRRLGAFDLKATFESGAGITALFGRSGAGKSSLINTMAGLLRPGQGRIVVDGVTLFDSATGIDIPAHRRRVGYVFQEGRLFPHLTVRENLLYGWRLAAPGERYVTLDQVVELLGIGHLAERRPASLSGGEKQRVAIGRALLAAPRLVLMDEPLASLDALRKTEVLQYIERLRDEVRVPIFYVSHALEEVMRLADTVVVMDHGRVIATGPAQQVMTSLDPQLFGTQADRGVVIEATVADYDAEYGLSTLAFAGGRLSVASVDALPGERVRVHVRARDVALALTPPADSSISNVLQGQVRALRGDDTHTDVEVDVRGTLVMARITRRSAERLGLKAGLPVYALLKSVSLDRGSVGYA